MGHRLGNDSKKCWTNMDTFCERCSKLVERLQGNDERLSLETCWGSEWEVRGKLWKSCEQTNGTIDVDDREVMGRPWGMLRT